MKIEINNPYSPLKIFHHQNKIQQLKSNEQPVPIQLQLIISDYCQQSCLFCSYRQENYDSNQLFKIMNSDGSVNNNPTRFIELEKCKEIIDDCKELGIKAIQITGGGSPTAHPKHKEIFDYVLDKELDLAVVTHGALLKDGIDNIYSNSKWIRVSLDCSNEKTYSKVRRVPENTFFKVLKNIEKILKARENNQSSEMILGVGFVVTEDNYNEIYDAVKLCKSLGVNNVRISAMFNPDNFNYFKNFHEVAANLAKSAKNDFENSNFKVFNLYSDRIQDLVDEHPDYSFCGYQYLNTYIGADLNIYRCCVTAYNDRGLIENLANKRLRDVWISKNKEDKYKNFDARQCPRCMFNNKNKTILYAIEENPIHINYI